MGGEEGFKIGPCMADILLFHDKVRSKTFFKKRPGGGGGRGAPSGETLEDSGRLPATTAQQDEGAK